jgi:hypothetical protein
MLEVVGRLLAARCKSIAARRPIAGSAAYKRAVCKPFNLLPHAMRHPSHCSHIPVCDAALPVALFLVIVPKAISGMPS